MTSAGEKERARLLEARESGVPWRKWGPYLSERQWGTVREDYSDSGDAWGYFTHDQARSRAYRWGEDGLAGFSDDRQQLCFAIALWNGADPILKERAFGLTNSEGNHGEDVKEYYFYLDSTPTHSYMKYLYKYPQAAYPYEALVTTNRRRTRYELEYELMDTGIFDQDRYFDVFVEYAKEAPEDILIRITACNRAPEAATLHLLPTLWFKNTWSWTEKTPKPALKQVGGAAGASVIAASQRKLGRRFLYCEGDVNPPVHAWATLFIYSAEKELTGSGDLEFLKHAFQKLLLNFTWWVNRKDPTGRNTFEGGSTRPVTKLFREEV